MINLFSSQILGCLMSGSLVLQGSHMVLLAKPALPFSHFFCTGFHTSFLHTDRSLKTQNRDPTQHTITQIGNKIIIETHPQPRPAKRLRLEGVKPLKVITSTRPSTVFPKAQSSQSKTKKGAEMEPKNQQKTKTTIPPTK